MPRRSSVLPWDIELLSGLVLAAMLLEGAFLWGPAALGLLLFRGVSFGVQDLWLLAMYGRWLVMLVAAYRLREVHAWARWWLLLDASVSVAVLALYPPALVEVLALSSMDWIAEANILDFFTSIRTFVIPPVTFLVLLRRPRRFPSIGVRELSLVCAGIGVVAVVAYRNASMRAWARAIQQGTYVRSLLGGKSTVTLRPTLFGRQFLADIPADRVAVTLRTCMASKGQLQSSSVLELPWHVRGDAIEIATVPAAIYHAAIIVRRPDDAPDAAPGELRGAIWYHLRIGSGPVQREVPLREVMRLTQPPVDTEFPIVTSPVQVAWQPVQGAAGYELALLPDDDYVVKDDGEVVVMVPEPGARVDLSPGGWAIELAAFDDEGHMLGGLSTQRTFVVVDPLAPEPVRPAGCAEWLPIPMCDKVPVADRSHVEGEAGQP